MNKKKIGILTHPLINNYGGILQAFALSSYIRSLGYEPLVIDRRNNRSVVKNLIISILKKSPFISLGQYTIRIKQITTFIEKNIPRTKPIHNEKGLRIICNQNHFDAIIVGSDQVWRAGFVDQYGGNYFLDFVPKAHETKKIAYAASMGLSEWNFSSSYTKNMKTWLDDFKSISVREKYVVKLLKQHIGCEATHVLDPTLLVSSYIYEPITSRRLTEKSYAFIYWLGDRTELQVHIEKLKLQGLEIVDVSLRSNEPQISVEDWLSYIKNADVILTDSFHGCVFSLIFHRHILLCNNKSGGYGRLQSLFSMLKIDIEEGDGCVNIQPDYDSFEANISILRNKSRDFLSKALA